MLIGSTRILGPIPARSLDPIVLAQSQTPEMRGYVVIAPPEEQEAAKTEAAKSGSERMWHAIFLRGNPIPDFLRLTQTSRRLVSFAELQRELVAADRAKLCVYLFEAPESLLRDFLSTAGAEPVLKVNLESLTAQQLESLLVASPVRRGLLERWDLSGSLPWFEITRVSTVANDLGLPFTLPNLKLGYEKGGLTLYPLSAESPREQKSPLSAESPREQKSPLSAESPRDSNYPRDPKHPRDLRSPLVPNHPLDPRHPPDPKHSLDANRSLDAKCLLDLNHPIDTNDPLDPIIDRPIIDRTEGKPLPGQPPPPVQELDLPQMGGKSSPRKRGDRGRRRTTSGTISVTRQTGFPAFESWGMRAPGRDANFGVAPATDASRASTAGRGAGSREPDPVLFVFHRLFRSFRKKAVECVGSRWEDALRSGVEKVRFLSPDFQPDLLTPATAPHILDLILEVTASAPLFKRARLREAALLLIADIYDRHYELLESRGLVDRVEQTYLRLKK